VVLRDKKDRQTGEREKRDISSTNQKKAKRCVSDPQQSIRITLGNV